MYAICWWKIPCFIRVEHFNFKIFLLKFMIKAVVKCDSSGQHYLWKKLKKKATLMRNFSGIFRERTKFTIKLGKLYTYEFYLRKFTWYYRLILLLLISKWITLTPFSTQVCVLPFWARGTFYSYLNQTEISVHLST